MIKSIEIKNYQSHKKTRLDFCEGINAIVGNSNSGKTSILRSLYWVLYNRPLGSSFISHWNIDDKENPIKNTSVIIENDKGIIERRKGTIIQNEDKKDFNGYILNDKILEAVGKNVPEEVTSLFNLDNVNIQKQLDSPFLLSESAGEVARFFNSLIKLDLIDNVLSKAESVRRETNKDIGRIEQEIIEVKKELETFDWLDKAEKLITRVQILENNIEEKEEIIEELNESIEEYKKYDKIINETEKILSAIPLVQKIDSINSKIEKSEGNYRNLKSIIENWQEQNKIIDGIADLFKAEKLVKEIDTVIKAIEEKSRIIVTLENSIYKWKQYDKQINDSKNNIIKYTKMLPKTCPLCGNLMEEDRC